jgi:hypothetical protein
MLFLLHTHYARLCPGSQTGVSLPKENLVPGEPSVVADSGRWRMTASDPYA